MLSLLFEEELWPGHPRAGAWSLALLALLLLLGCPQAIVVLWSWAGSYVGPGWARLIVRGMASTAIIGIAILFLLLLVLGGLLVSRTAQD